MVILAIFLLFQASMTAISVFFYSKDLEYILPLPISTKEILLSKFNTLLLIVYIGEFVLGFIPLFIYGLMVANSIIYFFIMLVVLIIFPVLIVIVSSIFTMLLMKIFSFIKNKNMAQFLVTIVLLLGIFVLENTSMDNFSYDIEELNNIENVQMKEEKVEETFKTFGKNYIVVNPSISILSNENGFLESFIEVLKLLLYNIFAMLIFVIIGRIIYLDIILSSISKTGKKIKEIKRLKVKKLNKGKSYIKKEIKMLFRRPTFFMQTVFPVIFILISAILIVSLLIPLIDNAIQSDENIKESLSKLTFNIEMACYVLIGLQVLFSISNLALTAISREGKDALFMKYIPIDLYKQFRYKNVLQIILNLIISIVVLGLLLYLMPDIGLLNIALIFIISIFTSLINSYTMLIVDLKRPNLNWNSEYEVIKGSNNKSFQYGFMIIMVLILLYIGKILEGLDIKTALLIEIGIFALIFIIYDRIVKRKIDKLFDKIY